MVYVTMHATVRVVLHIKEKSIYTNTCKILHKKQFFYHGQ